MCISQSQRSKRKTITTVTGLEHFGTPRAHDSSQLAPSSYSLSFCTLLAGVKLGDAAKHFGKKFACGSAHVKGQPGQPDQIDVQGDFKEEIVDIIVEKYKIPEQSLFWEEKGKKTAIFQ